MDKLVYFSVSFHAIPLAKADDIRKLLLELPDIAELGRYNIDYSNPIIEEDL